MTTPCSAPAVAPNAHFYVTPGGRCSPFPRGAIMLASLERKRVRLAPMPYAAMPPHVAAMVLSGGMR